MINDKTKKKLQPGDLRELLFEGIYVKALQCSVLRGRQLSLYPLGHARAGSPLLWYSISIFCIPDTRAELKSPHGCWEV